MNLSKNETHEAVCDPRPGDHFTEMMVFHLYVLDVDEDEVLTIEASAPCKFPDDGKLKAQTREEFRKRLSYGTIPGYWVKLLKRGCNVQGWLEWFGSTDDETGG
jgi:hypothetical protein